MRVHALLLAAAVAGLCQATAAAQPPPARFFLPEEPRNQHKLLLETLETLGIERFVPSNSQDQGEAAQDPRFLWSFLPKTSDQIDLVWSVVASPPYDQLSFSDAYRPKINHLPGAEQLTSSDLFYKHIQKNQKKHARYYFNYVPKHYELPRNEAEMAQAFPEVLKKVEFEMKRERDWFIYQRFLVREKTVSGDEAATTPGSAIINNQDLQAKLANDFKGKQVEVSSYIEPYLLDGHKFNVGFYVAVTSVDPLRIYVFNHAKVKIAKVMYPAEVKVDTDRGTYNFDEYYAPWDFPELQKEFQEFPSAEREGSNAWEIVKRYMMAQGLDTSRLQREINDAIIRSIASSRGHFQDEIAKLKRTQSAAEGGDKTDLTDKFFDLWKFDFEMDDVGKPWLVKVNSNPSLAPEKTVFGTDEAIKKRMLFDLLNLVGVHPQAKLPFDKFFRPSTPTFCSQKCSDKARTWDTACWSCLGWFPPYVAHRLFDSMHEYARRGRFSLLFPDLEKDHSKFLDTSLSEHDIAFDRYLKSLSSGYAEQQEYPLVDRKVICVYREHCSSNGDCVNGECKCDSGYEGATCYIPKDLDRENELQAQVAADRMAADARGGETWKQKVGHMWNRSPAPAVLSGNVGAVSAGGGNKGDAAKPLSELDMFSVSKLLFALVLLSAFLLAGYRVCSTPAAHDRKSN